MGIKGRVGALLAAALLAVGLAACGGGGSSAPEEVAEYQPSFEQPFAGREPRDPADLDVIVDDAFALFEQREGQMKDDAEETELAKKVNKKFNKANESYRAGDYAAAQEGYEGVLSVYPLHYGANVNLTLALLQQEKNEEALVQALSCMDIAPGEVGVNLNIQAAGVACGFAADDIETGMDKMLDKLKRGNYENDPEGRVRDFGPYYLYNKVWDNIETELRVAEGTTGDEGAAEAEDAAATEATAAAEAEREAAAAAETGSNDGLSGYERYEAIAEDLETLEEDLPDDTDVTALGAYLHYVGLQLGYEADPSLIEPMHTIPYIAVDNDLCTIRVASLRQQKKGEEYKITFDVTNKTDDTTFNLGKGTGWTLNGEGMLVSFEGEPPYSVGPGQTQSVTLAIGYVGEKEVVSVSGMIVLSSAEQNTILARYPFSWAAEHDE